MVHLHLALLHLVLMLHHELLLLSALHGILLSRGRWEVAGHSNRIAVRHRYSRPILLSHAVRVMHGHAWSRGWLAASRSRAPSARSRLSRHEASPTLAGHGALHCLGVTVVYLVGITPRRLLPTRRMDRLTGNQTQVNQREVAVVVDLAWRRGCTRHLVRIRREFPPLCHSETNMLSLIEFENAVPQDDSTGTVGNLREDVNLCVTSSQGDSSSLVAHFHLGESHSTSVHTILVDHYSYLSHQAKQ